MYSSTNHDNYATWDTATSACSDRQHRSVRGLPSSEDSVLDPQRRLQWRRRNYLTYYPIFNTIFELNQQQSKHQHQEPQPLGITNISIGLTTCTPTASEVQVCA